MRAILIFILLIIVFSCKTKEKPIHFMFLEKHSGKTTSSYKNNKHIYLYVESYLIDNLPEDEKKGFNKERYDLEYNFFKKNNKICKLEDDITLYHTRFYKKTLCSEKYINKKNDYTGVSRSVIYEECEDDTEYDFYYKRNEENPNMWILYQNLWGKQYHDTIYCDPNIKKVNLLDM
ncbi:hypothetical protein A8C32_03740 [Flavivirga aquatica]|uniref:Lipoprotein n=1 Tax=Flavivirga aquatica TaxID=1849968 RepID=A0A1E5TB14_9FLAO|nr:hypothetical protein [Flavivirga aquatica]OEK08573.1 hypothetical protein A8C32_03740 [Flavivirga aquatica]